MKDMLEGDNMYTCSKCQKKVRAEKRSVQIFATLLLLKPCNECHHYASWIGRACFKILPKILCFNTMRYTFNMVTMMKEKVNTHFSFPLRLDMSPYMENNLIQKGRLEGMAGPLFSAKFTHCSELICFQIFGFHRG